MRFYDSAAKKRGVSVAEQTNCNGGAIRYATPYHQNPHATEEGCGGNDPTRYTEGFEEDMVWRRFRQP